METLYIRNGDQTKSYRISTSYNTTPYLKVDTGYLNLTTETRTGMCLKVKIGTQTYRPYVTVTTTASRSSEYETPAYSGVSTTKSTDQSAIITGNAFSYSTSQATNTNVSSYTSFHSWISTESFYRASENRYSYSVSASNMSNKSISATVSYRSTGSSSTTSTYTIDSAQSTLTFSYSASMTNMNPSVYTFTNVLSSTFTGKCVQGINSTSITFKLSRAGAFPYISFTWVSSSQLTNLRSQINSISSYYTSRTNLKVTYGTYSYRKTASSESMSSSNSNSTKFFVSSLYTSTKYWSRTSLTTCLSTDINASNLSSTTQFTTTSSRSSQYNTTMEED